LRQVAAGPRVHVKVASKNLKSGMFVADLDRPWIDTPFLLQGFVIEDDEQIQQLQRFCNHVMVDLERSVGDAYRAPEQDASHRGEGRGPMGPRPSPGWSEKAPPSAVAFAQPEVERPSFLPSGVKQQTYTQATELDEELEEARSSYRETREVLLRVVDDITSGRPLAIHEIEDVVEDMVESMVRNPDALMLVARLRQQDTAAYGHGLQVAVYLVAFGRHLGFPREFLGRLGTMGLLLDVGKVKMPRRLLDKQARLSNEEFETIKRHVRLGLDILAEAKDLHPDAVDGVAQHHERENGSGYPAGLAAGEIGTLGRMGAIADSFAALTSKRPYAEAISAYEGLRSLNGWAGEFFHAPMVEQFGQAIGVFPVGSMIELSSGEVAIVLSHNNVRRLKPRVLVVTGPDKSLSPHPAPLDLLYQPDDREAVHIRRGLPVGAYAIDPREFYLA
jgi:HD-GYP domain-containing protein (c-di-GMP phosphodiesterase class II)